MSLESRSTTSLAEPAAIAKRRARCRAKGLSLPHRGVVTHSPHQSRRDVAFGLFLCMHKGIDRRPLSAAASLALDYNSIRKIHRAASRKPAIRI